jgi:hypothetical protein
MSWTDVADVLAAVCLVLGALLALIASIGASGCGTPGRSACWPWSRCSSW